MLNNTLETAQVAKSIKDRVEAELPKNASRSKIKKTIVKFIVDQIGKTEQNNEIVNLHHGKLEIDSQEGKGTLVTIYLPVENSPTKNELNDMKQNETVQDAEINEGVEINKN